jgi:pseudo-response regulator 5
VVLNNVRNFLHHKHTVMSSHDSISVVLKCMLKGSADFLVKPLRKNELRNLWQHVWRRQTVCNFQVHFFVLFFWFRSMLLMDFFLIIDQQTAGKIPRNSNRVEASSENNAASSDFATSLQKNKDCSEKGSDAQVSIRSLNCQSCRNM